MAPKYNVIVSSVAHDDLTEHMLFLARVSPKAARKLKTVIMKDIRSLAELPDRNPMYDRPYLPAGKYRYMLSYDRYRIVYQISGHTVYVDGVEDCRGSAPNNTNSNDNGKGKVRKRLLLPHLAFAVITW